AHDRAAAAHRGRQRPDPGLLRPAPPPLSDGDRAATGRLHPGGVRALAGGGTARLSTAAVSQWPPRLTPPYFMRVSDMAAALSSWRSGSYPASTISPMKRVWVPRSSDSRTSHSNQASASSKIGTPVFPSRMGRPLRVMPSLVAGLENFTNTRVSSVGHRLTEKAPDSLINWCVRALLSTPTPTSTGPIDNWVIHEAVMPFQRSPDRE